MSEESVQLPMVQGTPEWLQLRRSKITATDASVIMGASHWKTRIQLYHEKISGSPPAPANERMQRGIDLEPMARNLFCVQTGIYVEPMVVVKDWAMASLDGINDSGDVIVEIKCPGDRDHAIAVSGRVPDHYYPQVQHQIYVCDVQFAYYYSFDGIDGVIVKVDRDNKYIEKMVECEKKFYECLISRTAPDPSEGDYVERNDSLWEECAEKWKFICLNIKDLENQQEELRRQIIFLSGESNTKGGGISLCHMQRKGNVDYAKIPELKGVDLEKYRKSSTSMWRISLS